MCVSRNELTFGESDFSSAQLAGAWFRYTIGFTGNRLLADN
jgi:hypothetical protein